jgi:D-aminopeptidase
MARIRLRDAGLAVGELPTGPLNAITDVPGVRVGHTTLVRGAGMLHPGKGPVRTGVTVILPHEDDPFRHKVRAAVHTINGFGKVHGFEQVRELGVLEAPVALTNTMNVGLVVDALLQYATRHNPDIGIRTSTPNVVVGETHDGYLNDLQGRHVRAEHVWAAIENATSGPVAEGAVGAGTGTTCFGWKGGIGTASRLLPEAPGAYHVGALVQSNFGRVRDLTICGFPVGRHLQPPAVPAAGPERGAPPEAAGGSVMIVLATDAPLTCRQLERLCVRAAAGLARCGSVYGHGSGDFVIAFSTAHRLPHDPPSLTATYTLLVDEGRAMDTLFAGVAESVEEAVLNSLFVADTVTGRDGHVRHGLPVDRVVALMRGHRSLPVEGEVNGL